MKSEIRIRPKGTRFKTNSNVQNSKFKTVLTKSDVVLNFSHLNFGIVSDFVFRASNFKWGFTLVELLVVIAVVASIMAVLFPNFMGARQRARDAQRKSDIAQIQKALELYKLDKSPPEYPLPTILSVCGMCWSSGSDCTDNIYMRKVPCDPGSSAPTPYIYKVEAGSLKYTLSACLENIADPDRDPTPVLPACDTTATSYTVYEP